MAFRPRVFLGLLPALGLAACGLLGPSTPTTPQSLTGFETKGGGAGRLLGDQGLSLDVLGNNRGAPASQGPMLGVNAYLWRGALDTLSFMPLASADPFGGVIITDWWQPPQSPDERFKATAYILGRELTASALRLAIYRQVRQNGEWVDSTISPQTVADVENRVLDRARVLRAESGTP